MHLFCRCVTVNREDRFPCLAHWSLQMFAKQVLWPYKMHLCVKVPTLCFKHFLGAAIFAWGHASVSGSSLANYCTFPNLIGNSGFHLHGAYHWPQQKDYASCTSYEKKIIINFIFFSIFILIFLSNMYMYILNAASKKKKKKKKSYFVSPFVSKLTFLMALEI